MLPTVAFIVHCWRMDGAQEGDVKEEEAQEVPVGHGGGWMGEG